MWRTARCVAAAAAALLTSNGAAGQTWPADLVEIAVPDKVLRLTMEDGTLLVHTGSDHPFAVHDGQDGALAVMPAGALASLLVERPGLLPHSAPAIGRGRLRAVWLSEPTERYRHGVLGDRLEAAALRVRLDDGAVLVLPAGDDAVFEDLQPRLADLDGDGVDEIMVVKSYLERGAALAVIGLGDDGELAVLAETPPIGRPNRWLNPVGAADFDGDGATEIAYVETPHIGGTLMVWEWRTGGLVREHAEPGFSNHAIGSTELGLSAILDLDGDGLMDMVVPVARRDRLRLISLAGGRFREIAEIPIGGVVGTAVEAVGDAVVFGLEDGRLIALRGRP